MAGLRLLLLMATTIASNLAVFSDATGHGNQSHLVYAAAQQRWWLFDLDTKTATTVASYVSSSNDGTTATWSAGTASGAFPSSRAMTTNDQRNLGVAFVPNSINANDAVHLNVGIGPNSASGWVEHIRATFTGASSITWGTWNENTSVAGGNSQAVKGHAVGISTDGHVHAGSFTDREDGNVSARLSTNADTSASWTNGFGASALVDSNPASATLSYALATLASAAMLMVYDEGAAPPNSTGLRSNKYSSGTAWPTTGSVVTGNGTTSQDKNDWAICGVDTTHVFAVRRSGSTTFDMQMYSGTAWAAKTAPPTQAHKAGSGIFLATDGTDLWMFVLNSAVGNQVLYCKYTVAGDSWGTWTELVTPSAGGARNYISGYPVVSNNQIGVIWTEVNGSNFDIVTSFLSLGSTVSPASLGVRFYGNGAEMSSLPFGGVY